MTTASSLDVIVFDRAGRLVKQLQSEFESAAQGFLQLREALVDRSQALRGFSMSESLVFRRRK